MVSSEVLHDFSAGCIGGLAGLVVGHPFDTTKVLLQTKQTSLIYKGSWDAIQSIQKQGLKNGFFRGLAVPFASYGLVNAVFFGVYGNALKYLKKDNPERKSSYSEVFIAGCIGGMVQLIPACPTEVVKTVLQSQIPHGTISGNLFYKGPTECIRSIVKEQGFRKLYRGVSIQAIRDVPASAIYFVTFEYFNNEIPAYHPNCPRYLASFFAGGMAGVLSWVAIMPFDVVKSQVQADVSGRTFARIKTCICNIYRQKGVGGFYCGVGITVLRAFPVNGVTLMVYNECMNLFQGPEK